MGFFDRMLKQGLNEMNTEALRKGQQDLLRTILEDWIENEFDSAKQSFNNGEPVDSVFRKIAEVEFLLLKCEFALPHGMNTNMRQFLDRYRREVDSLVRTINSLSKLRSDAIIFLTSIDYDNSTTETLYNNMKQLYDTLGLDTLEDNLMYSTMSLMAS